MLIEYRPRGGRNVILVADGNLEEKFRFLLTLHPQGTPGYAKVGQLNMIDRARLALVRGEITHLDVLFNDVFYSVGEDGAMPARFWRETDQFDHPSRCLAEIIRTRIQKRS